MTMSLDTPIADQLTGAPLDGGYPVPGEPAPPAPDTQGNDPHVGQVLLFTFGGEEYWVPKNPPLGPVLLMMASIRTLTKMFGAEMGQGIAMVEMLQSLLGADKFERLCATRDDDPKALEKLFEVFSAYVMGAAERDQGPDNPKGRHT
jgi:hypothetical protein